MKTRILLAAGVVAGSLALPSTAGALECSISDTGPASNNTCVENVGKSCTVNNNNVIIITNTNNQQGSSGSAGSSGNTNGGSATSGGATNTNTGTVSVGVDNTGACVVASVPTPTPTPTPTPAPTPTPTPQPTGHVEAAQVQAPVGGVKAGSGGTDTSGLLVGLLGASVLAIGAGLRKLHSRTQS